MRTRCFLLVGLMVIASGPIPVSWAEAPPAFVAAWGSLGSGPGQFSQPYGIEVDNNLVYVADQLNDRVQVLTTGGAFVRQWAAAPTDHPTGLAIGPSGIVYVSMHHTHHVNMYSNTGTFLGQIGSPGSAPGQFIGPVGVVTDASGNLYVADSGNNRIQKFTAGGAFLMAWGGVTTPYGIAINAAGRVFVTEAYNYLVKHFTDTGFFVTSWGTQGPGDGQLVGTNGLGFDAVGNVYVVDAGTNNRIAKFTGQGGYLTQWGGWGTDPGQLEWPADVAVGDDGNVYVTDWYNNRIQVFGAGATPAKTVTWGRIKADYR